MVARTRGRGSPPRSARVLAENSTSSVYSRASLTAFTAASSTAPRSCAASASCGWARRDEGVDALALGRATASPAAGRRSRWRARASDGGLPHGLGDGADGSKSPALAAANPASITSTRSRSSCLPILTFSSRSWKRRALLAVAHRGVENDHWSCMGHSEWDETSPARLSGGTATANWGWVFSARGAAAGREAARGRRSRWSAMRATDFMR